MNNTDIRMFYDSLKKKEGFIINHLINKIDYSTFEPSYKINLIRYLIMADTQINSFSENAKISKLSNKDIQTIANIATLVKTYPKFIHLIRNELSPNELKAFYSELKNIKNNTDLNSLISRKFSFTSTNTFTLQDIKLLKSIFNNMNVLSLMDIVFNLSNEYMEEIAYVNSIISDVNPIVWLNYLYELHTHPIADENIQFKKYNYLNNGTDSKYKFLLYLISTGYSNVDYKPIGSAILDVLNNANTIKSICKNFSDAIADSLQKSVNDNDSETFIATYYLQLGLFIKELSEITPYLCFVEHSMVSLLKSSITKNGIIKKNGFKKAIYETLELLASISKSLDYYSQLLEVFSKKKDTFTFNIPAAQINYSIRPNTLKGYFEYEYKITNIDSFFNVSLYHIINADLTIAKCKSCNRFFVTHNKRDDVYCSNPSPINSNYTCLQLSKMKDYDNEKISELEKKRKTTYDKFCVYISRSTGDKKNELKQNRKIFQNEYIKKLDRYKNDKLSFEDFIKWIEKTNYNINIS